MIGPRNIAIVGLLFFLILPKLYAQDLLDKEVEISFYKGTRAQFIDTVKSQTNINFLYSDLVKPQTEVEISLGRYSVKQLLDSIFVTQEFSYLVRDDLIILAPQGQNHGLDERITIKGKVATKKGKPVPFATVYLKAHSLGTIANGDGYFRLNISESLSQDTLVISSMGFENGKVLPEEYRNGELLVTLRPSYIPIKNVIVRPTDPENLVMQSYKSRDKNYNRKTSLLTAFFRESSKQNEEYISLTEALIEINKSSYLNDTEDLIKLVKGRNGTNIQQSDLVNLVVEGGLYNGLRLDVAKYGSYFYGEDALNECDFEFRENITYNGRHTYVIWFDMKEQTKYSGFTGKLYLDAESLALVRAEFELSPSGIKYARSVLVKKTPKGFKAKPVFARYEVEYRYYNDVWNLHYARSELKIKVRKARGKENKGNSCDFTSKSEFVVTDQINDVNRSIRYREAVKSNDVLVKQVKDTKDNYWMDDNVIVPEEPLLSTIEKLQRKGVLTKEDSLITKENK